jgi:RNA polymerase sigma factor (sigma-70 family)
MSDEELIARYKETGSLADRDAVIGRYVGWARRYAAERMQGRCYAAGDVHDAEEIAEAAVIEAVKGFDPAQAAPFSAFVVLVVKRRVDNFILKLQRNGAHYDQAQSAEATVERTKEIFPASARPSDPAELAEEHEQQVRFDQAVEDLPRDLRIVVKARCAGMSLRKLAAKWGRPYPTVRELNREAFDRLKRQLRPRDEEK